MLVNHFAQLSNPRLLYNVLKKRLYNKSLMGGGKLLLICIVSRRGDTPINTHWTRLYCQFINLDYSWGTFDYHDLLYTAGPLDRLNYVAPLHVGGLWWWLTQTNLILHQSIVLRGINNINIINKRQANTRFQGIVSLYLIWLIQFRLNSQICVNVIFVGIQTRPCS